MHEELKSALRAVREIEQENHADPFWLRERRKDWGVGYWVQYREVDSGEVREGICVVPGDNWVYVFTPSVAKLELISTINILNYGRRVEAK